LKDGEGSNVFPVAVFNGSDGEEGIMGPAIIVSCRTAVPTIDGGPGAQRGDHQ